MQVSRNTTDLGGYSDKSCTHEHVDFTSKETATITSDKTATTTIATVTTTSTAVLSTTTTTTISSTSTSTISVTVTVTVTMTQSTTAIATETTTAPTTTTLTSTETDITVLTTTETDTDTETSMTITTISETDTDSTTATTTATVTSVASILQINGPSCNAPDSSLNPGVGGCSNNCYCDRRPYGPPGICDTFNPDLGSTCGPPCAMDIDCPDGYGCSNGAYVVGVCGGVVCVPFTGCSSSFVPAKKRGLLSEVISDISPRDD
ncbi:hypothetical protein PFICI_07374 [Pestalotiopsis fici W106-1]|uniref:Uncharacterized protein n=1 Tax=Pestalotiopsis fici (strain W106-1 / CGMCC3.15140) TaxID=1229662 RepID=W3X194_PESFW|nr:uncharacterized protein PFICI_07374 [Pestalotiopsis fici W106-1]ETS79845.1 hypothetical protein PFICI_07374 [Pestalotiopsis fici W106-1]